MVLSLLPKKKERFEDKRQYCSFKHLCSYVEALAVIPAKLVPDSDWGAGIQVFQPFLDPGPAEVTIWAIQFVLNEQHWG